MWGHALWMSPTQAEWNICTICHYAIGFMVKSDKSKKNNEKVKNVSQNEIDSGNEEIIYSSLSLNGQLAQIRM